MGNINGARAANSLLANFISFLHGSEISDRKKRSNLKVQLPRLRAFFHSFGKARSGEISVHGLIWREPHMNDDFNGNFIDQKSRGNEVEGL